MQRSSQNYQLHPTTIPPLLPPSLALRAFHEPHTETHRHTTVLPPPALACVYLCVYIGRRCRHRARPDITRLVQVAGGGFFIGHKTKPQRAPVPQVHLTISPFSLTRSTSIPSSIGGNVNFQGDLIEVSFALESTGRKTARLR